jgi:phosphate starvation-inducible PhoH-like protein
MAKKKVKEVKQEAEIVIDKDPITLLPLQYRNEKQRILRDVIKNHDITIVDGCAGTGKTFISIYEGLYKLLCRKYDKLILCKSVTTTPGEDIGYIPGTVEEKMTPYILSFKGNMEKVFEKEEHVKRLFDNKMIEVLPLAYIRGVTLDNSFIVIDEVQNISMDLFKSIITRIGDNSKMVFLGDIEQCDFNSDKRKKQSALQHIIEIFKDDEDVGCVHFEDDECVRNPIIPKVLNKLREFEKTKN